MRRPVYQPRVDADGGVQAGVDDEEAAALGQLVHARAGREIFGVLGAAVEYDQERQRLSATPLETYSLCARPGPIRERPDDEPSRQSDLGLRGTHPGGIPHRITLGHR